MRMVRFAAVLLYVLGTCTGGPRKGYGPGMQDWGFVEVRKGAHMFWWLYYTTADVQKFSDRPLIIWLQGGPGSSSQYGNFLELGPQTLEGDERNHTWVRSYNVLFIDSPVGAGFSYVEDESLFRKTNAEIADDLLIFTKEFYRLNPEFKRTTLHIYTESYGGKMVPEFAYVLHNAIQKGEIDVKLESVVLIAPWVSPIDSILSYPDFLLNMGFVDTQGYKKIQFAVTETERILNEERFEEAYLKLRETYHMIRQTLEIDFYNVLRQPKSDSAIRLDYRNPNFYNSMRGQIAKTLQLPSESVFGAQEYNVSRSLNGDHLRPVTHIVELLLNNTDVEVVVITGQLDFIIATPGNVAWLDKLQWKGRSGYLEAPRIGVGPHGLLEGYQKSFGKLSVYWALRAGHLVPVDNPFVMDYVLRKHARY
ncbi:retinoid-inducible serine carboxypeptidase-like [Toxorhynchites rutilus septentrionalis]|uniref:retinoid-inducible serine carboxypeptidase-like n=1 Tax=Toxorhynchites rutilus septentrionalis TaxID=329112 RepID=UPI002478708C|nr:retinoid-inducible serine carboxypeptidase-like [Toxorhynchites rutilus septentrionalis]